MQPSRAAPKKGFKFLDTKVFIASLSIAVTIGLWNFFSKTELLKELSAQNTVEAAPAEAPVAGGLGLPPLPTLIPLADVPVTQENDGLQDQPAGAAGLRSVTAPDQVIIQKVKPAFDDPGIINAGGGSSTNRSSKPRARSSR